MTEVGSKNPEIICRSEIFRLEFRKSDVYFDLGNYKDMSQLELSKKIPKWQKHLRLGTVNSGVAKRRKYLLKFCRKCDHGLMFRTIESDDDNGHLRRRQVVKDDFWIEYVRRLKFVLKVANEHYQSTKALHDAQLKERMTLHQNSEVSCECGGKYSLRNKQKHFKTQKHIQYCQSCECRK
jgi:hypothetical protein